MRQRRIIAALLPAKPLLDAWPLTRCVLIALHTYCVPSLSIFPRLSLVSHAVPFELLRRLAISARHQQKKVFRQLPLLSSKETSPHCRPPSPCSHAFRASLSQSPPLVALRLNTTPPSNAQRILMLLKNFFDFSSLGFPCKR